MSRVAGTAGGSPPSRQPARCQRAGRPRFQAGYAGAAGQSIAYRGRATTGCMRHRALVGAFITVLLSVVIGGHVFLARRLVLAPALPAPWRGMALAAIALGGILLVLEPIGERTLPRAWARWIAWPASLWMGFAFLAIVLLFGASLTQTLLGATLSDAAADGRPGRICPGD